MSDKKLSGSITGTSFSETDKVSQGSETELDDCDPSFSLHADSNVEIIATAMSAFVLILVPLNTFKFGLDISLETDSEENICT